MKYLTNLLIIALILTGHIACGVNNTNKKRPLYKDSLYVQDIQMQEDFIVDIIIENYERYRPWPSTLNQYHVIRIGGRFFSKKIGFPIVGTHDSLIQVEGNIRLWRGDTVFIRKPNYDY